LALLSDYGSSISPISVNDWLHPPKNNFPHLKPCDKGNATHGIFPCLITHCHYDTLDISRYILASILQPLSNTAPEAAPQTLDEWSPQYFGAAGRMEIT